jgi:hypothetical protein
VPVIAVGPDAVECNPTRPLLFNELSDEGGLWIAEKRAFNDMFRTLHNPRYSPVHFPPFLGVVPAAPLVIEHRYQLA